MHPAFALARARLVETRREFDVFLEADSKRLALLEGESDKSAEWVRCVARASGIEGVYTGIENVLKEILGVTDGGVFGAPQSYHAQLLAQAAQKTDAREALVGNELYQDLDELRAFRHRERVLYRHVLREDRVNKNMALLKHAFPAFETAVNGFFEIWERKAEDNQKEVFAENKPRLPDDADRARKDALAEQIVAIARRRRLEMPDNIQENLVIYAGESDLERMLKDVETARSFRDMLDARSIILPAYNND